MALRSIWLLVERPTVTVILAGIRLAAFVCAPWRLGRLLRSVSVPRLAEHGARTTLTVLGIGVGVSALVAVTLIGGSGSTAAVAAFDAVAGKAELQVRAGATGFTERVIEEVRAHRGVLKAAPVVQETPGCAPQRESQSAC